MLYFNKRSSVDLEEKMKTSMLALAILVLTGCGGEEHQFKDFTPLGPGATEKTFARDSKKCESEKDKYSHKIRGREAGYTGSHAGFLGCMQGKGWERKSPELY
jgi:hypothetical protein